MFIRHLERGECPEHRRCTTAALHACEECGVEFIAHGILAAKRMYCGPKCNRIGTDKTMKRVEEERKKRNRIQRIMNQPV